MGPFCTPRWVRFACRLPRADPRCVGRVFERKAGPESTTFPIQLRHRAQRQRRIKDRCREFLQATLVDAVRFRQIRQRRDVMWPDAGGPRFHRQRRLAIRTMPRSGVIAAPNCSRARFCRRNSLNKGTMSLSPNEDGGLLCGRGRTNPFWPTSHREAAFPPASPSVHQTPHVLIVLDHSLHRNRSWQQ